MRIGARTLTLLALLVGGAAGCLGGGGPAEEPYGEHALVELSDALDLLSPDGCRDLLGAPGLEASRAPVEDRPDLVVVVVDGNALCTIRINPAGFPIRGLSTPGETADLGEGSTYPLSYEGEDDKPQPEPADPGIGERPQPEPATAALQSTGPPAD